MKKISRRNVKEDQNRYRLQEPKIFQTCQDYKQTTSTMNTRNTEHFLSNRVSKRKRQHRNGRSNKTKGSSNSERKKNIS